MPVELEVKNPPLTVYPKLVVLSGSDGAGKDTILDYALRQIDQSRLVVVDLAPTKGINPEQEAIAKKLREGREVEDLKFAIGYALPWERIKEDLREGKIVVAKKPLHFLTHLLTREPAQSSKAKYLERWVARGKATLGCWPSVWIEVEAEESDVIANLIARERAGQLTEYDPKPDDLEKVRARVQAEKTMLSFAEEISTPLGTKVIKIRNPHVDNPATRKIALQKLGNELISQLPN